MTFLKNFLYGQKKFPEKIVGKYIKTLQGRLDLKGVLLFGSYAYGRPDKDSDIDLIIISPDFNKQNWGERVTFLNRLRRNVAASVPMDLIGYTPKEFISIEKESSLASYAKNKGKWIYGNEKMSKAK